MKSIKRLIISGAFYTGLSKYSVQVINIGVTVILARLLSPYDFGLITVTIVVTSFFDIMANVGMGPAIIQNKRISRYDTIQMFRFSFILAILLSIVYCLIIHPISNYYNQPQLLPILGTLMIQLFFNTLNVVPYSLLLKEKKFKLIAKITISSSISCGLIAIGMAFLNAGVYALVVIPIGNSIILFACCFKRTICKYYIKSYGWNFYPVKKIFKYSVYQFSFNVVNYFSRNLDKILLGKYIGMESLGFYEKSYRLMTLPISTLTNVFAPTIQPILSEYQSDLAVIRNVYNKISSYLFFIGCILVPLMFFSADSIILILFGSQWINTIPMFQILAISIPFQLVDSLSGSIFQSSNDVKHLFVSGLICSIINVISIILSLLLFSDIIKIVMFISMSLILNFFITSYFINKYSIRQSVAKYLLKMFKFLIPGIIGTLILYLLSIAITNIWMKLIFNCIIMLVLTVISMKITGLASAIKIRKWSIL